MTDLPIRDEYITLGQLLKLAGLVGTGGEVKHILEAVPITVNGETENRRGRKIKPGDTVVVEGSDAIRVIAQEAD